MVARLKRATGRRCRPEDCVGPTTALVERTPTGELRDGTGGLHNPDTAARCRRCGHIHLVEVEEVIVGQSEGPPT